jgi:hypothetical protein
MKKLRPEVSHPTKQLGNIREQLLRAVQLEDPLGQLPKHSQEGLDTPFVVNVVVVCHKAQPNVMNAAGKRRATHPLRRNGTSDYIVSEQGLTPV